MSENAAFENDRIIALTNLGNMLSNKNEQEQNNLNPDLPLLLLMIGILTDDINRINYVNERWGEQRFISLLQTPVTNSPWTLGVLCNMGISPLVFIDTSHQRPSSPTSIFEDPNQ